MNNLYDIEYGIQQQKENLKRVDRLAWKIAKFKAIKAKRNDIKRLESCEDCLS